MEQSDAFVKGGKTENDRVASHERLKNVPHSAQAAIYTEESYLRRIHEKNFVMLLLFYSKNASLCQADG